MPSTSADQTKAAPSRADKTDSSPSSASDKVSTQVSVNVISVPKNEKKKNDCHLDLNMLHDNYGILYGFESFVFFMVFLSCVLFTL